MTQLIGGQANSKPVPLSPPPHYSCCLWGKASERKKKKPWFSGFSSFSWAYQSKPPRISQYADSWKADVLPLHTKCWLFRVALPSIPDKSGQPEKEERSLLEVKVRSVPWGKTEVGIGPQMGRHVLARPQNSLSPRRGPIDSLGHLKTAYFKLICNRHARTAAGPQLKGMVCHWQKQSGS